MQASQPASASVRRTKKHSRQDGQTSTKSSHMHIILSIYSLCCRIMVQVLYYLFRPHIPRREKGRVHQRSNPNPSSPPVRCPRLVPPPLVPNEAAEVPVRLSPPKKTVNDKTALLDASIEDTCGRPKPDNRTGDGVEHVRVSL